MIKVHGGKFTILKALNPDTNRKSTISTDFSFTVWGEITADYFISVKNLDKHQFQRIFDAALNFSHRSGRYKQAISIAVSDEHSRTNRADLHSESDSDEENRISSKLGDQDYENDGNAEADYMTGYVDPGYNDW